MNYSEELNKIETKVNNAKIQKAKLEERQRSLNEERTKILEELKTAGITEEQLADKINSLEIELQTEIEKCQEILK